MTSFIVSKILRSLEWFLLQGRDLRVEAMTRSQGNLKQFLRLSDPHYKG